MVNYDADSVHNLPQVARNAVALDQLEETENEPIAHSPSPPSRLVQLELERIVRIAEAPQTRNERARVAQEEPVKNAATFEDEFALPTVVEPSSYRRAVNGTENAQWQRATRAEIDSHLTNVTWKLIPCKIKMRVIGSM